MNAPKFKNKNGTLTAYAFACGYVERKSRNGVDVDLFKDGCWHVQARSDEKSRFVWECFDSLGEARKFHRATCGLTS